MTETGTPGGSAALEMRGVRKTFGDDVVALDAVDFVVARGRIHALLGENGAGKSTLMRIAYGLLAADAGTIDLFGVRRRLPSVPEAVTAGIGMVHQHLSLVPNLSPAENIALGRRGVFRPRDALAELERTAQTAGLPVPRATLVRDLGIVERQRLEILKALTRGARLLILDEPTAVLAPSEADELLRWVREFADHGGSVVLVTHKLREALAVADDVTVLRRGRVAHAGLGRNASADRLARAMFPEKMEAVVQSVAREPGEVVTEATSIAVRDDHGSTRLRSASFTIRRHEIVGVAAVEGSGHRELLLALAGLRHVSAGSLHLADRIALIPADRSRDGLIPDFTLAENVALHALGRRRGLMPWRALSASTESLLRRFSVVASSARAPARTLSGGNQQRLVIARELEHEVDLVIADNPTRGLDIQATRFVHDQLRAAAARGAAVVVHATDVDDVLTLATRVLVVFHGVVRETSLDRDRVGRAMLGVA